MDLGANMIRVPSGKVVEHLPFFSRGSADVMEYSFWKHALANLIECVRHVQMWVGRSVGVLGF